jgi:hypothetical protein
MHRDDQPAQTRNQITKALERDLRVGDYPTTGTQLLGKVDADGAAVMIGVNEHHDHQKGAYCMELEDDMRLDLPKTVCWSRAHIPMGMDQITCQQTVFLEA